MRYLKLFEDFSEKKNNDIKIIDWKEADKLIPTFSTFRVIDKETGKSWMMQRTSGRYHADVEPMTKKDTRIMSQCFPEDSRFENAIYRPVIIEVESNFYGAALMGFPHAGSNSTSFKKKTLNLSGGFKDMPNWDYVRDNDTIGHFCLHFKGSRRHTDKMPEIKAQEIIEFF